MKPDSNSKTVKQTLILCSKTDRKQQHQMVKGQRNSTTKYAKKQAEAYSTRQGATI